MQVIKTSAFLLLSMAVALFSSSEVWAKDAFTIEDVLVAKTAENASEARKQAIEEAEKEAFDRLIKTVTPASDFYQLSQLSDREISNLVNSFEVSEEKITGKSYKARFTISFHEGKFKKLLASRDIAFVKNKSPSVLVIPIFQEKDDIVLWDAYNPWRDAWNNLLLESRFVQLILPLGDLDDIAIMGVEDAFSGNFKAISKLAKKYDSDRILIAEALYEVDKWTKEPNLKVIMRIIENESILDRKKAEFKGVKGEIGSLFDAAVKDIILSLEQDWKKTQQDDYEEVSQRPNDRIHVLLPIDGIEEWVKLKKRITDFDLVDKIEVRELSVENVVLDIYYRGDFTTFSYFLHTQGFRLLRGDKSRWLLKSS